MRAKQVIKILLLALSLFYILLFVYLSFARLNYHFETHWLEGLFGSLVHRILEGHSLYVAPSADFTPVVYTPLYFYVSAFVALVFHDLFFSLRLVSLLSCLSIMAILALWTWKETRSRALSFFSAGLFASSYSLIQFYHSSGRIDSFHAFTLVLFAYALRFSKEKWIGGAFVLFSTIAFFTKQTSLWFLFPFVILFIVQRRWWPLFVSLLLNLGLFFLINLITKGYYFYYMVTVSKRHLPLLASFSLDSIKVFLKYMVLDYHFLLPTIFSLVSLYVLARIYRTFFYLALALGGFCFTYYSIVNPGADNNVLVFYWVFAPLLFALTIHACSGKLKVFLLLPVLQLVLMFYHPESGLVSSEDIKKIDQYFKFLSKIPGEIYFPIRGSYMTMLGRKDFANVNAVAELLNVYIAKETPEGKKVETEIQNRLKEKFYSCIVIESAFPFNIEKYDTEKNYKMIYRYEELEKSRYVLPGMHVPEFWCLKEVVL